MNLSSRGASILSCVWFKGAVAKWSLLLRGCKGTTLFVSGCLLLVIFNIVLLIFQPVRLHFRRCVFVGYLKDGR